MKINCIFCKHHSAFNGTTSEYSLRGSHRFNFRLSGIQEKFKYFNKICTIQRLYSILKGEPLDEALEELTPAEQLTRPKKPLPVVYSDKVAETPHEVLDDDRRATVG